MQIFFPQLRSYPFVFRTAGGAIASASELALHRKDHRTRGRERLAPGGLFLRFAALEGDQRGFEEFASHFGPLTLDFRRPGAHTDSHAKERETLERWKRAHAEMVEAVEVWRAGAEERLSALCQPHLDRGLYVFLSLDDTRSGFPAGLVAMPRNLLSLMWVQLAQAASGEGELRKCEECPNWFVVTHDNRSRTSRKYCSSTCRVNAYRRLSRRDGVEEGDDGR